MLTSRVGCGAPRRFLAGAQAIFFSEPSPYCQTAQWLVALVHVDVERVQSTWALNGLTSPVCRKTRSSQEIVGMSANFSNLCNPLARVE